MKLHWWLLVVFIGAGIGASVSNAAVAASSCRIAALRFDSTFRCPSDNARAPIAPARKQAAPAAPASVDTASPGLTVGTPSAALPIVVSGASNLRSKNWSGYSISGGPFTVATGTFNVPSLAATAGTATTSEWVGIDGGPGSRGSLIQAGVTESYDASTQLVTTYAWWEILPSWEMRIPLTVAPDDQITVTIGQVSAGLWSISLVDETTGQSFSTQQAYSGGGGSADWIVEAPSQSTGAVDTLGEYTPVTFGNLGVTGPATATYEWGMVQSKIVVSLPSALTAAGFTIAYGPVAPAPPG
ncbi:MAG TPA: G1 family glutamic endopeptidase [Gaiellaceae bacterium]|nr:G1 family glutamic endopeptidase [Gaiellaceae bacterium]